MKDSQFEQQMKQAFAPKPAPDALKQRLQQIPLQFPQPIKQEQAAKPTWWVPAFAVTASVLGFMVGFQGMIEPQQGGDGLLLVSLFYGDLGFSGMAL